MAEWMSYSKRLRSAENFEPHHGVCSDEHTRSYDGFMFIATQLNGHLHYTWSIVCLFICVFGLILNANIYLTDGLCACHDVCH